MQTDIHKLFFSSEFKPRISRKQILFQDTIDNDDESYF